MFSRRLIPLAATLGLAAFAPSALAADTSVEVPGKRFVPAEVTATVGDTVTWRFGDGGHNAFGTSGGLAFDSRPGSGTNPAGSTWSQRFDRPGTFEYVCTEHGGMEGRVVVRDVPAPAPSAPRPAVPPSPAATAAEPLAGAPGLPAGTLDAAPAAQIRVLGVRGNRLSLWVHEPSRFVVRHVRSDGARRVRTRLLDARPGPLKLRLDRWMGAGRHRVTILALDAAGNASQPVRLRVRVG
jgi:plastocyanin